jgi:hypothetical protein
VVSRGSSLTTASRAFLIERDSVDTQIAPPAVRLVSLDALLQLVQLLADVSNIRLRHNVVDFVVDVTKNILNYTYLCPILIYK